MSKLTANEIFFKEYDSGKNFMTPNVIRRDKVSPTRAYELSSGLGFTNDTIYGVTVVDVITGGGTKRRTDLCGCYHSLMDAEDFIDTLDEVT